MSVGATGVGEEQGNEDFSRTSDRWTWSGARDRPARIGGRGDKVPSEREAAAFWSPAAKEEHGGSQGGSPRSTVAFGRHLVERPVSLTEHDCLALGAAYNGWQAFTQSLQPLVGQGMAL